MKGAGHDVTVMEEAAILSDAEGMSAYDALVFNTRRENLPDFGDWELEASEKEGLKSYIKSGKGFVCIHIACCVPSGWSEFDEVTGGGWVTGTSYHPPYGEMSVNISNSAHAGAKGVSDFVTNDELYMNTTFSPEGNDVFLTGDAEDGTWPWGPDRAPTFMPGGTYPLGWTRNVRRRQGVRAAVGTRRAQLRDAGVPADRAERSSVGWGTIEAPLELEAKRAGNNFPARVML